LTKAARYYLLSIVAAVAIAAGIGFLFGRPWLFTSGALAILLALNIRNLLRLEHWLRNRTTLSAPDMPGPWGEVVAISNRLYRRKVFHKRRVMALLREFRRMTAAMPDGVVLLGPDHEILWFNRTAGDWLGLRRKLDYGNRIENLVRHPEFVKYMDSAGRRAEPRIRLRQHGERCLAIRLVATDTATQKLLVVRDVTREAQLDALRRDFVANASHELRSPLTVISGYVDAMASDPDLANTWQAPAHEMLRQTNRMRDILQDLLELSKLEATGGDAERSRVDVGGLLALLRKEVLSGPQHPASVTLDSQTNDWVLGSETELNSIFSNLISNAVKYTPSDGQVALRWWTDSQGGHVEVRDTGIGIAGEHIPRLTERFYRVDPGRSRKLGGSGLGLAIVKHALQRHGGRLEIQSKPGEGSVFTCHFPRERIQDRESVS
jgi:two-component system phosphate regulon sensor histidine kinase PhoR